MESSAVLVLLGVCWLLVVIWATLDAFTHTDMGCMWVSLFVVCSPLTVPVYLFMRFYADRGPSREVLRRRELERDLVPVTRFPSEIEKARYIAAADQPHGTMYEPGEQRPAGGEGYRHFTDNRAETLLNQRRFPEAFAYLADLYQLAVAGHDVRAQDTYRHYIAQIPAGLELLRERLAELAPDQASPPRRTHRDDDMPF